MFYMKFSRKFLWKIMEYFWIMFPKLAKCLEKFWIVFSYKIKLLLSKIFNKPNLLCKLTQKGSLLKLKSKLPCSYSRYVIIMHLQVYLHPYTDRRRLQNLLVEFHIEMYNRFSRLKNDKSRTVYILGTFMLTNENLSCNIFFLFYYR